MTARGSGNLALVLAVVGWALATYGVLSQMGDPWPLERPPGFERARAISAVLLLIGLLCLTASLWFSGRAFAGARKRSLLGAALVVIPIILIAVSAF